MAAVGESQDQRDESRHQYQLQDQGRLEEGLTGLAPRLRIFLVGAEGSTVGSEDFNDGADS